MFFLNKIKIFVHVINYSNKYLIMTRILYIPLVLCLLFIGCNIEKTGDTYKYRPQIHFSPKSHWMNDPNGMVYHNGEYHLFYQHYPEASHWGPMHWGHAISKDLIHWEHMPIALYPDSLGYIFSGSAVVDKENTSGLGTIDNPPLLAFYTYHDPVAEKENRPADIETQAIAYSLDNGRNWIKYENNPVIENPGIRDFRDPKVIWYEEGQQWVMSIAAGNKIMFYTSSDCLNWSFASEFGEFHGDHDGVWECPDLFPLEVKNTGETKWVLIVNMNPGGPMGGSATQYFVGDFDGKEFTTNQFLALWLDYGKDNYAGVTWSNTPDDRRILAGWMNNWQYAGEKPTVTWSGALTFPREMGLVNSEDFYFLTSTPIKEIEKLYGDSESVENINLTEKTTLFDAISFEKAPVEIVLTFDVSENTRMDFPGNFGIRFSNSRGEYYTIGYDNVVKYYYADRTNSTSENISEHFASLQEIPYIIKDETAVWRIIVDKSSMEFFTADGEIVITNVVYPTEIFDQIEVFVESGKINLLDARITELKSIW